MLKPSYSWLGRRFWKNYIQSINKKSFRELILPHRIEPDPNKSLLLLANHVSWWDGFWAYYLNDLHWGKRFHVMMLEEQLKKHSFLRQAGAYSIQPGRQSVLESLQYTSQLLEDPQNMVLFFPQGKIHSLYVEEISFASGANRVIKKTTSDIQVVFGAVMVDFLEHKRPGVYYYLEEWKGELKQLGSDYQKFYAESMELQKIKSV